MPAKTPMRAILAASTTLLVAAVALPAQAQQIGDIFYIAMENHNWTQPAALNGSINPVYGDSAAPFIQSLVTPGNPNAVMVSYASNYQNVPAQTAGSASGAGSVHPSEPNYVWSEAGIAGPRNDSNPYPSNVVNAPSFRAQLQSAGIGWKSYQEDTNLQSSNGSTFTGSSGGTLTNTVAAPGAGVVPLASFSGTSATYTNPYNGSHQYNFAAKHEGSLFFTATNGGNNTTSSNPEAPYYAPMQQLSSDLANNTVAKYNWITPDQYNDMHSALSTSFVYNGVTYAAGTDQQMIALGDNFLSIVVPQIEASQAFKNNGEIVIWNDETEGGDGAGYTSMEIVISPLAKGNAYTNNILYTHSSDLLTNEQITNQPCLADACNATSLSDLFVNGATVPEPASMAVLATGILGLRLVRRRK